MTLQIACKMAFFPLCLIFCIHSNSWAEESTSKSFSSAPNSATTEITPPDEQLPAATVLSSNTEVQVTPMQSESSEKPATNQIFTTETPLATPQTATLNLPPPETLEESLQKITVMAKVLNALGPEVDETLRNAALDVAEADKANDKQQYQQAVQAFEILYEKHFGKTEAETSVQGLAESLQKVGVMSRVIEVMNPKSNAPVTLRDAAKRVFEADNAGDRELYLRAVSEFETLYQATMTEKMQPVQTIIK